MHNRHTRHEDTVTYKLWPETDAAGAIEPNSELTDLLNTVDEAVEQDLVDDFDKGVYWAITEIMACPTVALDDKYITMLDNIKLAIREGDKNLSGTSKNSNTEVQDDFAGIRRMVKASHLPVVIDQKGNEKDLTDEEMEQALEDKDEQQDMIYPC